jgi:hypothetical protein
MCVRRSTWFEAAGELDRWNNGLDADLGSAGIYMDRAIHDYPKSMCLRSSPPTRTRDVIWKRWAKTAERDRMETERSVLDEFDAVSTFLLLLRIVSTFLLNGLAN